MLFDVTTEGFMGNIILRGFTVLISFIRYRHDKITIGWRAE